jgi:cell fate regulator YaaT (PSP1 superfamily)
MANQQSIKFQLAVILIREVKAMENKDAQEQNLLFKQLTHKYIKEQLEDLKNNKNDKNKSFIYLESKTLNMFILYMILNLENKKSTINDDDDDQSVFFSEELVKDLDSVIDRNKSAIEELISLLKD